MTSIQGAGQAGTVQFHHDPIHSNQANPMIQPHLDSLEESYLARMDDLNQQIANTDSPTEKLELQEEMRRLEGEFHKIRMHPDAGGPVTGARPMDIGELIADMRQTLVQSYERFGTADFPAEDLGGAATERSPLATSFIESQVIAKPTAQLLEGLVERLGIPDQLFEQLEGRAGGFGLERIAANAEAKSAGEVSGGEKAGEVDGGVDGVDEAADVGETAEVSASGDPGDVDTRDPRAMMELFSRDPDAFYEALLSITDPQERMAMMSSIQNELQKINQLFTMMSQFSQSIHDTHKAVINNLRV